MDFKPGTLRADQIFDKRKRKSAYVVGVVVPLNVACDVEAPPPRRYLLKGVRGGGSGEGPAGKDDSRFMRRNLGEARYRMEQGARGAEPPMQERSDGGPQSSRGGEPRRPAGR